MSLLRSLFSAQRETKTIETTLDMVTYAAGLASNPADIDPLLDRVRSITARLGPGQSPSAEDDQSLVDVYLQVEQYLTLKEPIRAFSKVGLRARLAPELRHRIEEHEAKYKENSAA